MASPKNKDGLIEWVCGELAETELPRLRDTLIEWCEINSGTDNLAGIESMQDLLMEAFAPLAESCEILSLPPLEKLGEPGVFQPLGKVLRFRRRPMAPVQVLFNGHYDTVYGTSHPFQRCEITGPDGAFLSGPGTADMKGGLLIMREAIRLLERFDGCDAVGWEIILNPDEEIGTPGSREILREAARGKDFALVYECSTLEGALVHRRAGVGNFHAVAEGQSAHAGRALANGRNAIEGLADFVLRLCQWARSDEDILINPARFHAQSPLNIVPDHAVADFNVRAWTSKGMDRLNESIATAMAEVERSTGVRIHWSGLWHRPPRLSCPEIEAMERALESCLDDLGQPWSWIDSAGGTDGSLLLDYGLANLDSLGPRGSGLHSSEERIALSSLVERSRLSALFLLYVATGQISSGDFRIKVSSGHE